MLFKSLVRLWNYLNIYYLKPFDAVNDTITSDLLLKFKWKNNYLELGSGDGMFSFVMHGNSFPLWFDRYQNINFSDKNIFKSEYDNFPKFKKKYLIRPNCSVDARQHHIISINKIGFSKSSKLSSYEKFKYKKKSENLIFFYTPHGLQNYTRSLKNILPSLKNDGRIILLLNLKNVLNYFICYDLSKNNNILKKVFKKLDNGRYLETKKVSKSFNQWSDIFKKNNLKLNNFYTGLSPITWMIYDVQTRPILRILIRLFNFFPRNLRTLLKLIWMVAVYPAILIVYLFGSKISQNKKTDNCYVAFELTKKK
ncbi:hypothetical protein OAB74_02215 [Candidatus Pelagibacter sp.]|nr:hypothetical protein [Candidatus Pelagibacter sp.]